MKRLKIKDILPKKIEVTPKTIKNFLKDFFVLTVCTILVAISINYFLVPSNIVDGGMTGIALIIRHFIGDFMSIGTILFILNVILLLLSFILIGPEFSVKTIYVALVLGPIVDLCQVILPWQSVAIPNAYTGGTSLMGDLAWDMMAYLVLFGASDVILFLNNASSGGTDIIAKIINKYTGLPMSRSLALASYPIIVGGLLVNDFKLVIVSLIVTLAIEWIMDYFTKFFRSRKQATIVTDSPEEIKAFIVEQLHKNCEIVDSQSGKSGIALKEIDATLTQYQYARLKSFIDNNRIDAHVRAVDIADYTE